MPEPAWWTNLQKIGKSGSTASLTNPIWVDGPAQFNDLTIPGTYLVAGDFLNGDAAGGYNQPGNTGAILLRVTVVRHFPGQPMPAYGPVVVIQEYISVDAANHGGQRRRWANQWSGWAVY
jgi:hypothetical protein